RSGNSTELATNSLGVSPAFRYIRQQFDWYSGSFERAWCGSMDSQPAQGSQEATNAESKGCGAGDGTRTRDALLGRQVLTFSSPVSGDSSSFQHFLSEHTTWLRRSG